MLSFRISYPDLIKFSYFAMLSFSISYPDLVKFSYFAMLSFSISYPDLIKFSYFADTTELRDRGAKAEGERDGDFTDNYNVGGVEMH